MCQDVHYKGRWAGSLRGLRALLGCEPLYSPDTDIDMLKPVSCLCGVDHEKTAALVGCRAENDGVDWFYHDIDATLSPSGGGAIEAGAEPA